MAGAIALAGIASCSSLRRSVGRHILPVRVRGAGGGGGGQCVVGARASAVLSGEERDAVRRRSWMESLLVWYGSTVVPAGGIGCAGGTVGYGPRAHGLPPRPVGAKSFVVRAGPSAARCGGGIGDWERISCAVAAATVL